MFTGIVTRSVQVLDWTPVGLGRRLRLSRQPVSSISGDDEGWDDVEIGESIAVNGVCLTVVSADETAIAFDVVPETLEVSALGDVEAGHTVNLERAMRVGDRFGGHYVLGHVDGVGRIDRLEEQDGQWLFGVEVVGGEDFRVLHKGSVTIDGVSLTVTGVDGARFTVALIPHTMDVTSLGRRRVGERVNLEMDHIGKWVMALMADQTPNPRTTS